MQYLDKSRFECYFDSVTDFVDDKILSWTIRPALAFVLYVGLKCWSFVKKCKDEAEWITNHTLQKPKKEN